MASPTIPGHGNGDLSHYVTGAIDDEIQSLRAVKTNRNDALNIAAFNLGTMADWPEMVSQTVRESLYGVATEIGLTAREIGKTIDSGWEKGRSKPRVRPECNPGGKTSSNGKPAAPEAKQRKSNGWVSREQAEFEEEKKRDALLASYKPTSFGKVSKELGGLHHLWLNWLVEGLLSMVFSKPKIGKTRTYIQFIKILWESLQWPDGAANDAPKGSKTLVLPYDRNHLEIAEAMEKAGIPDEAAVCPHDPRDPLGVSLLAMDDPLMKRVLAKILADDHMIKLIIVDTLTYASGKSLYKPEDMKALLDDIMELAARHKCALLVLVHENKEGEALGRRIGERARIHWHLERINESDSSKLRLTVKNSNFVTPKPLLVTHEVDGVTFQSGNALVEASKTIRERCARWLVDYLNQKHGIGVKVDYGTVIRAAGDVGYAGTWDPINRRWSAPTIVNDAVMGINERKPEWQDLHVYTVHKEKLPGGGRYGKVAYWLTSEFGPPF